MCIVCWGDVCSSKFKCILLYNVYCDPTHIVCNTGGIIGVCGCAQAFRGATKGRTTLPTVLLLRKLVGCKIIRRDKSILLRVDRVMCMCKRYI